MLGKAGVNFTDLQKMTLRDIVNTMNGYFERQKEQAEMYRDMFFESARFNAVFSTESNEIRKKASRYKFNWQKKNKSKRKKPIAFSDMLPFLNSISKSDDNG